MRVHSGIPALCPPAPLAPEALPICSPTHPLAHEGPIVFLKYLRISPLDPMLEDALQPNHAKLI